MANLITLTDPRSAAAEAIRTLRTNLMFSSVEKPLHAFLVSAAMQPEDKSITAANLAVAFAQSGHKTILVDADLRRPQQHNIWKLSNETGLTTMMIDDSALANPPLTPAPGVDALHIMPAGPLPPSPADLLASQRMNEIISLLKVRADYVIFDAPPVLVASDTSTLGQKLDGVLLVVRAGKTRREHALNARKTLARVHVHILGAVLSNAPRERTVNYS